jgi:hypothetical protein
MSDSEITSLKSINDKLINENENLTQLTKVLEKFRLMLISMVNNCKCDNEFNIRFKFNILMEQYFELKDQNKFKNNNRFHVNNKKFNKVFDQQIDDHFNNNNNNNNNSNNSNNNNNVVKNDNNLVENSLEINQQLSQTVNNVSIY